MQSILTDNSQNGCPPQPHFHRHSPGLLSTETIAATRDGAASLHYPLNKVRRLQCDLSEQERTAHVAATRRNAEARAAATLEASKIGGMIEEELDRAADTYLAVAALAFDRRHLDFLDQHRRFLEAIVGPLLDKIDTLAERVADLELAAVEREESVYA